MAESEVFIISLLSIIILAIQVGINFYLEWRRQEKEDKRLIFERQQHKEQLQLERKKYELELQKLKDEKAQNALNYENRLNETYLHYLSTIIGVGEKAGLDLSKGDWKGQVESIAKKVSQPINPKERIKIKKEELMKRRQSKKSS
ncbi:MAG: hypothetical protein ACFFHD_14220 [Promethearchaeota archaeon]